MMTQLSNGQLRKEARIETMSQLEDGMTALMIKLLMTVSNKHVSDKQYFLQNLQLKMDDRYSKSLRMTTISSPRTKEVKWMISQRMIS